MPYEGDSPFDAWEYWFDEPPSEEVRECLSQRIKTYSTAAVIEAIQITGAKDLADDTSRLRYLSGVLRRKQLEAILPDGGEEERQIDIVRKYWDRQGFGFPLSRKKAREWLSIVDLEDLCALINIALSWTSLRELLQAVQDGVPVSDIKILRKHAETWTEFRLLVEQVAAKRRATASA